MAEWAIGKKWGKWDEGREAESLLERVGSSADTKQNLITPY